jgi:hypothetical protein
MNILKFNWRKISNLPSYMYYDNIDIKLNTTIIFQLLNSIMIEFEKKYNENFKI